jgi:hypothetical protein
MAWNLYDTFRRRQITANGDEVNLETATLITIALVTSAYTPNQNTDGFWSDVVANEVSGTNYSAGGNAIANPTVTMSGAGLITFDADDPADWLESATGFSNARRAVLYFNDGGGDAVSELIAYSDDFGMDKGNVGGDLDLQLDASGIFTNAR